MTETANYLLYLRSRVKGDHCIEIWNFNDPGVISHVFSTKNKYDMSVPLLKYLIKID
jgi:hypothetical protein